MTTKVIIENAEASNGDVVIRAVCTTERPNDIVLFPGARREIWITTSSSLFITETWPTKKPKPETK